MLSLTRKARGKGITIITKSGEVIRLVVLDIKSGGYVRLGFEADPTIRIMRDEIVADEVPSALPPEADARKRGA